MTSCLRSYCLSIGLFSMCASMAFGQEVMISPNLDSGVDWTVVADADTEFEFGFDYSRFGLPEAQPGQGTTGLRMAANIADGAAAVISATPNGLALSGQYTVEYDFWINYNSSGGTTEFIGGFAGFDVSAGNPRSGAGFLGDSDGDSARDFRLYKDSNEQFVDSGQYNSGLMNNNGGLANGGTPDPLLVAAFPGQTTPAAQGDGAVFDPTNVIVTALDGTLGYAWHKMLIAVDSDAGTANFAIDGFEIGTIDSNIGDAVGLTGGIALTYADLFTSVSSKPEFSFGVFDNLVVTQVPEPSNMALLAVSLLGGMCLRRRR